MTTEQAQKLGQQYDQLTEKIITKVDERKQRNGTIEKIVC